MHLSALLAQSPVRPPASVPDWMLGCFRRRTISFADGRSDIDTTVYWLQSRNFTIDLRLPRQHERLPAKPLAQYTATELRTLGNNEGWCASSIWENQQLRWEGGVSLQLHNRWPEPALLQRVGNCMIEFAPSNIYVEDWRLQPSAPGPLIGLTLERELRTDTGETTHTGGGLIICGDYAGLVLGRPASVPADGNLRDLAQAAAGDSDALAALFAFETSVGRGSLLDGYTVIHSSRPGRQGSTLTALDGFSLADDPGIVVQELTQDGIPLRRRFRIDTLEAELAFSQESGTTAEAGQWFSRESETLGRYLQTLD